MSQPIQYWQLVAIFAIQPLGHSMVAELIGKRGKCIKSHTLAPKLTFCYISLT